MVIYNQELNNYRAFVMLKISQKDVANLADKYDENKQAKLRIENTEILVIDEISMLGGSYFDMLNACFKIIRKHNKPFGGMTVIVTGDF